MGHMCLVGAAGCMLCKQFLAINTDVTRLPDQCPLDGFRSVTLLEVTELQSTRRCRQLTRRCSCLGRAGICCCHSRSNTAQHCDRAQELAACGVCAVDRGLLLLLLLLGGGTGLLP
jgi:hypothetical protein